MKYVEFIVRHGIDLFFKNVDRNEMPGRINHQTAVGKPWSIHYEGRIIQGKLFMFILIFIKGLTTIFK